MARLIRIWGKKRGDRRTGSRLLGGVGEAIFYAGLALLGTLSLVAIVTARFVRFEGSEVVAGISGWGLWLTVLVLVSFVVIGVVGGLLSVMQVGVSAERRASLARRATDARLLAETPRSDALYPNVPRDDNLTNSPGVELRYRLPIARSPGWRLFASATFALVWNGIVSMLVVVAVKSHLAGQPDWLLTMFVLPFTAVGGWCIYYFLRQLMLATGIGPTSVEISDHPLLPGKRYDIFVSQSGRLTVRSLDVSLVCDEEASYRQGTDIRTETRRVRQCRVFRSDAFEIKPGLPFESRSDLEVPADVMHSFRADHNALSWKVVVKGEAVGWPPYERSFPVIIHPPACPEEDAR